jgi:serine/threonine protein kinase
MKINFQRTKSVLSQNCDRLITEESNPNDPRSKLSPRARGIKKIIKTLKVGFRQNPPIPPHTTLEFYRVGKALGKGAFGKVNLAVHKLTQQFCALKSINKQCFKDESQRKKVMHEVLLLRRVKHLNIVRLFEYFETEKHILIVIELCKGGDLLNYVRRRRRLKEDVAKCLFKQLIESLAYCHSKSILHRDIKLDNILLDANGLVKICDFGVGKIVRRGEKMTEQCGTPAYIAPEILRDEGYYGFAVDIWSSGVVLYAMLYGTVPFKANQMSELQKIIINAEYSLKEDISAEARDMIKGLLEKDPEKRMTIPMILNHPWLRDAPRPQDLELFSEQERQYINSEFQYNRSAMFSDWKEGNGYEFLEANDLSVREGDKDMFTEHDLDSVADALVKNAETRSIILAPFNSTKSNLGPDGNPVDYEIPEDIKELIVSRRVIKFGAKVRDIDKQYEINNNADMDNGVYNHQETQNNQEI